MSGAPIVRFFVFIVYCSIPFLGGNHLPLFYVTIDKFWIENLFLLCLVISLMFLFLSKKNAAAIHVAEVPPFFCALHGNYRIQSDLYMEYAKYPERD